MDVEFCECGKRLKRQCDGGGAEVQIALVHVYYRVRPAPGEESSLKAVLGSWCLRDRVLPGRLTTDWTLQVIMRPAAEQSSITAFITGRAHQASGESDVDDKPVLEAVATYLTDRLDEALDGGRLDIQLWASSETFPPAAVAQDIAGANVAMNDGMTTVLKRGLADYFESPSAADVLSRVSADLVLAPIARPLGEAKRTVEIIALCVAVLTMQPALAVACAKAILHEEIAAFVEKSIVSALSVPAAVAEVDEAEDIKPAVSSVAREASPRSSTGSAAVAHERTALQRQTLPSITGTGSRKTTDKMNPEGSKPSPEVEELLRAGYGIAGGKQDRMSMTNRANSAELSPGELLRRHTEEIDSQADHPSMATSQIEAVSDLNSPY